ncbi:hypothetical protein [Kitasatospora griseola]|uniref:hypothetical protein n=1 Tax=Kitasatospora griseola TaxID=2064 RepID=UPI00380F213F
MTALLAEFDVYLDREGSDPVADQVGHRQHTLWLSPAEMTDLIGELRAAIAPRPANHPAPGRAQYLLGPIHFPVEAAVADTRSPASGGEQPSH